MSKCSRQEVYIAIDQERDYQDRKWGIDKPQGLCGFFVALRHELNEAELAWVKGGEGRDSALHELRQVAALAVAALEKYGTEGCPRPTDDIAL